VSDIFISYRRGTSSPYARGIYERLEEQFGPRRVFMDIDTMEPGVDFVDYIKTAVSSCRVLIVVISPDWVSVVDDSGHRRLDDPEDFVRVEVTAALEREDVRVIPVLVGDAPPPQRTDLPPDLAPLTRRQALEVTDGRWDYDLGVLARTITRVFDDELPGPDGGVVEEPPPEPEAGRVERRPAKRFSLRRPLLFGGAAVLLLVAVLVVLLAGGGGDGSSSITTGEMKTAVADFKRAFVEQDVAKLDALTAGARYTYLGTKADLLYDDLFTTVDPVTVKFYNARFGSSSTQISYKYFAAAEGAHYTCGEGPIHGGTADFTFKKLAGSGSESDVTITEIADRPGLGWDAKPGPSRTQSFKIISRDKRVLRRQTVHIDSASPCLVIPLNPNGRGLRVDDPVSAKGRVRYAGSAGTKWHGVRSLQRGIG